jgi:hypothetical protein
LFDFVLPDSSLQNLQAPDHIAFLKEFANSAVTKPFRADQGGEDLADLRCGESGVIHFRLIV